MVERHSFRAVILQGDRGGAYVEVPFDVEQVFGRKRVPVNATIDGARYRGSVVRMGSAYILGVLKDVRRQIGRDVGDEVDVLLTEDVQERTVDVPAELADAFAADPAARALFDGLSYTHRREYVQWITEAKRDETRRGRVTKTLEMLRTGRKQR